MIKNYQSHKRFNKHLPSTMICVFTIKYNVTKNNNNCLNKFNIKLSHKPKHIFPITKQTHIRNDHTITLERSLNIFPVKPQTNHIYICVTIALIYISRGKRGTTQHTHLCIVKFTIQVTKHVQHTHSHTEQTKLNRNKTEINKKQQPQQQSSTIVS